MSRLLTLQRIAWEWGIRAFGQEHMTNRPTRALRLAEEAIELAQACSVDEFTMARLVHNVYARPKGDIVQELGGVMVTTGVMCFNFGLDMEAVFETEMLRVLAKPPAEFAKRNEEKMTIPT